MEPLKALPVMSSEKDEGDPAQARDALRRAMVSFLKQHPDSPAAGLVATELAQISEGWWRVHMVPAGTVGGNFLAHAQVDHAKYMKAALELGHTWQSVTFSTELAEKVPEESDRAWIHLRCGEAYQRGLLDPDRALAEYEWVTAHGAGVSAWPRAQWEAAQLLRATQQYALALSAYQELIKQARSSPRSPAARRSWDRRRAWNSWDDGPKRSRSTSRSSRGIAATGSEGENAPGADSGRLSERSLETLYRAHPEDLRAIEGKLEAWQRQIIEELAKKPTGP